MDNLINDAGVKREPASLIIISGILSERSGIFLEIP